MNSLEKRINDNVEYWTDEWEIGDNTVFKMELDEDELELNIDWINIDVSVIGAWTERNYLYIELDKLALMERFDSKWKEWDLDNKYMQDEFWKSRGI